MTELISSSKLAAQTLAQIAEVERRIANLVELRDGLRRVFNNVSRDAGSNTPERHPAGSRRAIMEHVILKSLEAADGGPLKTRELFDGARAVSALLNYATFRSYLHRLKKRGIIVSEGDTYGSWKLRNLGRPLSNAEDGLERDRAGTRLGGMRGPK